ncbi:MAG: ribbon-helix-helix domain-containing protein [Thermoanaerobaculaceae bacterium]|nr:ribbon-helix-helix domain-containing protein [Thermoanaerobaculaceae bacterium]
MPTTRKTIFVGVQMDPATERNIDHLAVAMGRNRSDVIRLAVDRFFEELEVTRTAPAEFREQPDEGPQP